MKAAAGAVAEQLVPHAADRGGALVADPVGRRARRLEGTVVRGQRHDRGYVAAAEGGRERRQGGVVDPHSASLPKAANRSDCAPPCDTLRGATMPAPR